MYWVYMLECSDRSLYTGWTKDVAGRVVQHNAGKGAKYTRSRLPVQLVYSQRFSSQGAAMRREYAIKKLSRRQKAELL